MVGAHSTTLKELYMFIGNCVSMYDTGNLISWAFSVPFCLTTLISGKMKTRDVLKIRQKQILSILGENKKRFRT